MFIFILSDSVSVSQNGRASGRGPLSPGKESYCFLFVCLFLEKSIIDNVFILNMDTAYCLLNFGEKEQSRENTDYTHSHKMCS